MREVQAPAAVQAELAQHLPAALAARLPAVEGPPADSRLEIWRLAIWPENWDAVSLFVALSTQWRRAGMTGARSGLDYTAIAPTAALAGIEMGPELLSRLQVMEGEVLRLDAERRAHDR